MNSNERIGMYVELGMLLEAANAAFSAKSMEGLTSIEAMSAGREDLANLVRGFKEKLTMK